MKWRSSINPIATARRKKAYTRGVFAEYLTALMLIMKGYRILALRYRSAHGEIDLVAARGNTLVFIEVKARPEEGESLEAVTMRQRLRIQRAAEAFMQTRKHPVAAIRFDVVACLPGHWPRHHTDAWRPL